MQFQVQPIGVGSILALLALIIVVVLLITGQLPFLWLGLILLLLAASRFV